MKVIILCGGQGTRIRDANELLPKPLLPIGERPMVWHIMKSYAAHGFTDFVLALGFKGWLIKEYFLNYEAMTNDLEIQLGSKFAVTYLGTHEEQDYSVRLIDTGATPAYRAEQRKLFEQFGGRRNMSEEQRAQARAQLAALVLHLTLFALGAGAAFVLGLR